MSGDHHTPMNPTERAGAAASPRPTFLAAALIIACGLAVYSNSLTDLFVGLDTKESIRDNPFSRRLWPPSEALSLPLWTSAVVLDETPGIAHRPTYAFSLALITSIFGLEPRPHQAANIAIHIAAALALFGIIRRTLARRRGRAPTWLAVAAALIWLVHPLQTESVTYIAQRSESLMGLFLLLTLYCAIRAAEGAHRHRWQAAAMVACLLGTGSKQTAALAPLLILLYDYTFTEPGRKWWRPGFYVAVAVPAWIVLLTIAGKVADHFEPQRYLAYALAQPRVVLHYLRLSIWPDDLYVYVNTHLFDVSSAGQVVMPAAALVGLLGATLVGLWRRHWLGFIGAWFFITLGPTSIIAIADVIQEHRMYIPLAAVVVLAVVGGDALLDSTLITRTSARRRCLLKAALAAGVVLGLAARTYVRNWDYHHEFATIHPADLHEDYRILADHYLSQPRILRAEARQAAALLQSPRSDARDASFAHFVLGLAYEADNDLGNASRELERALAIEPDFAYAHHRLGVVLGRRGDRSGAIEHLETAIRLEPDFVYAYKELALALKEGGDLEGAEKLLEHAVRTTPGFGEGHFELGIIALERGDTDEAVRLFERSLRDRPDLAEAHYELGMIALGRRDLERARQHFTATIELRPDFIEAQFELGILWRNQGDLARAAEYLGNAARLRPDSADFLTELGRVELSRGDTATAGNHFRRALAIDPGYTDANEGLAEVDRRSRQSPPPTHS